MPVPERSALLLLSGGTHGWGNESAKTSLAASYAIPDIAATVSVAQAGTAGEDWLYRASGLQPARSGDRLTTWNGWTVVSPTGAVPPLVARVGRWGLVELP